MPDNLCQDAFRHKTRSSASSFSRVEKETHSLLRCKRDSVISYRIEQCLYPIKTRTEGEKSVSFVICCARRWNRGSWLPFKVVCSLPLVLPHSNLHALKTLRLKYMWTHLVMGKSGCYSSEDCDFSQTRKWQRKVKETSFSYVSLSFFQVKR